MMRVRILLDNLILSEKSLFSVRRERPDKMQREGQTDSRREEVGDRLGAAANGMAVPVGLVFALLPMLGQFNGTLAKVSDCTYSGRLRTVFEGGGFTATTLLVPGVYFVALSVLLLLLFRRKGME